MNHPAALMMDLYQLKMAAGYFKHGLHTKQVSFELFVRKLPTNRRYMVSAGLESVLEYLRNLRFSSAQVEYLKEIPRLRSAMSFDFIEFLRAFRFQGDVWAMPEGTVVFANEPLVRVTGNLLEAQLVETFLLSTINTQTAVATKAARIVQASAQREAIELGSRRTSPEEAIASARAAYISGFEGTSNVEAGYRYDIPLVGTAAHSWTMSHNSEVEAFQNYVDAFPKQVELLVDTYETHTGTQRAIDVAKERLKGVRIDSGDMLQLSKSVRAQLDQAGLDHVKIIASGDLNEYKIQKLLEAKAPIDVFGVGTELVRTRDNPTLGAVYKLVHDHTEGRPVAKFSQNKATLPGLHQVYRVTKEGRYAEDVIGVPDEFHVDSEPLLTQWMKAGRVTQPLPNLQSIRARARDQLKLLPDSARSLVDVSHDAGRYPVRISDALHGLIAEVQQRETIDIPSNLPHPVRRS